MSDAEQNKDTQGLLDGRESTYGNVVDNAARVANIWNGYLGTDIITPADMMMMMALYKAYRFKVTPEYSDNINDVLGYAEIVRQVQEQTGGLIHAETVKEFLEKKNAPKPPTFTDPVIEGYGDVVVSQQIASDAQAGFHQDYDLNRKVRMPRPQTLDEIIEEQDHRAAEEEIKEGRRPPHLRLRPENPEAVREVVNMESWLRNRCGKAIMDSDRRCRLHTGHSGICEP
ncbi:hypothetical protein SEA_HANNABELLA_6 [Microbacterium phage Hannabella]|nr:hypothetical protein SEA_HANNABELLA_6 [Microbacterium phage Hannabella]